MNKRVVHKIFTFAISPILSTALFIMPVHADDYEFYYPDPDQYSAYQYFINHGYSNLILSDTSSNSVTYNVNLSSNIELSGSESGQEHTTGTINSSASTLGAKYLKCTTNNAVSGTQTYSCYFSNTQNSVSNSQSITLKLNENTYTSVNNDITLGDGSSNTPTTGTISSTVAQNNKLYEKMPWLSGTYIHKTSYDHDDYDYVNPNYDFYLIFYSANEDLSPTVYTPSGSLEGQYVHVEYSRKKLYNTLAIHVVRVYYDHEYNGCGFTINLRYLDNQKVIPIFYGKDMYMTDETRKLCGMPTLVEQYLSTGDNNTPDLVNNAESSNTGLTSNLDNLEYQDTFYSDSMTNRLTELPRYQESLINDNNFMNAALWVKTQYDRITVNTPIGLIVQFSLLLGIALIFIGRIR